MLVSLQAARVQELLQELAALSADAGPAATKPDGQLAIDLGERRFGSCFGCCLLNGNRECSASSHVDD